MNPLPPNHMSPAERRAVLCAILALGLVRLRIRKRGEIPDDEERVAYTSRPTNAVMQPQLSGDTHDKS